MIVGCVADVSKESTAFTTGVEVRSINLHTVQSRKSKTNTDDDSAWKFLFHKSGSSEHQPATSQRPQYGFSQVPCLWIYSSLPYRTALGTTQSLVQSELGAPSPWGYAARSLKLTSDYSPLSTLTPVHLNDIDWVQRYVRYFYFLGLNSTAALVCAP